jgi:hypothetical protein
VVCRDQEKEARTKQHKMTKREIEIALMINSSSTVVRNVESGLLSHSTPIDILKLY